MTTTDQRAQGGGVMSRPSMVAASMHRIPNGRLEIGAPLNSSGPFNAEDPRCDLRILPSRNVGGLTTVQKLPERLSVQLLKHCPSTLQAGFALGISAVYDLGQDHKLANEKSHA